MCLVALVMPEIHVIGAGMAGLAAAVSLVQKRLPVTLYEAAGQAGGRCRSFVDKKLQCVIDNGNHLLLTGNKSAMRYISDIGAADRLIGPEKASFPFVDVRTGQRWCVRPNPGILPWWILSAKRRVPDTRARDYLTVLRFLTAPKGRTVYACAGSTGALYDRFWKPLAVSVLNTPTDKAAACLLRPVLLETFARGDSACQPRIARRGLSDTLVDPALEWLHAHGATVWMRRRLRRLIYTGQRVTKLDFGATNVALGQEDRIILALPAATAGHLLPAMPVPEAMHAIVNVHFRVGEPPDTPHNSPLVGIVGGTAHWVFMRGDVISVTVSAADALAKESNDTIAQHTWHDVAIALDMPHTTVPMYRIITEKHATFAQTPDAVARRPATRTDIANLYLAGDWIDTGLPATIEGAIRSGHNAARAVLQDR